MATPTLPPKVLADGNTRLVFVETLENPEKPTVTELNDGLDLSCRVLKTDFQLGPTDSETVDDQAALCESSNPVVYGASNYEGMLSIFRWFDSENPGKHDEKGDIAFQALKTKGTQGFLVKRESGKAFDEDFEEGDEVEVYLILTDNPQMPGDTGGYIRRTVPLGVQNGWTDAVVASGSGGTGGGGE